MGTVVASKREKFIDKEDVQRNLYEVLKTPCVHVGGGYVDSGYGHTYH